MWRLLVILMMYCLVGCAEYQPRTDAELFDIGEKIADVILSL